MGQSTLQVNVLPVVAKAKKTGMDDKGLIYTYYFKYKHIKFAYSLKTTMRGYCYHFLVVCFYKRPAVPHTDITKDRGREHYTVCVQEY